MARFVIQNKLYDTSKMKLIGRVKKWYEYRVLLLKNAFGEGSGQNYACELYRSEKGNWLLTHKGDDNGLTGEAINEEEAKQLLMQYDYEAYAEIYGDLEEA